MKKFKAEREEQKLLNEEQFSAVFSEYLQVLDEFDTQMLQSIDKLDSLRYHVEIGLEEHAELSKKLYKKHEEEKAMKKSSKLA